MTYQNAMETIVQDVLKHNLQNLHLACDCERCLDDIMATALNNLPARYIVNPDNQPYVRVVHEADPDGAINILKIVTQAVALVSKQPRCKEVNEQNK